MSERALRLLPWTGEGGNPCYVRTDDGSGRVSRLADEVEAAQSSSARTMLVEARALLGEQEAGSRELRFALARASEALSDMLRIAHSRGARLGDPIWYEDLCDDL